MSTNRLEAFSDGVIAIIITIMVLELRPPHGVDIAALRPLVPAFAAYLLSFVVVGIYWNNHHHLFHATEDVDGTVLWANLHLLLWLSLIPFTTAWVGDTEFARLPMAMYGVVLLGAAGAYELLQARIVKHEGPRSRLATAIGTDLKGKVSLTLYASAIPLAFVHPAISGVLYATVAAIWFLPDRRIEERIHPPHPAADTEQS